MTSPQPFKAHEENGVYSVHYNSENHLAVMFQRYGSVWPKVLPHCLVNVGFMALLHYLKVYQDIDLSVTDKGHNLMSMFVAFLVVSRVTMALGRYSEARNNLNVMYRESRELIQNMAVFTRDDQSDQAKQWRHEVAWHVCLLLRLSMAVLQYPTTKVPCYNLPELQGAPKEFVFKNLKAKKKWAKDSEQEENMRVPIHMAYLIRNTLFDSRNVLAETFAPWQYNKLYGSIDSYMGGYYGMRKFMTTPFPFPLVQMARTFLFFYVYTIPFALLSDHSRMIAHLLEIFLVTYGFVGLETVSIELDDPFGNDDNDFDNVGMAMKSMEDTCLTINDVDGPEWAEMLRSKMDPEEAQGYQNAPTESSGLLCSVV